MLSNVSQPYSDLKDSLSSLHSSESLGSVAIPSQAPAQLHDLSHFQIRMPLANEQLSSITDLDETIKSLPSSSKPRQLHMATEVVERYDEGVFDDGATSQTEEDENNSVVLADSDDEDEIEHFDSTDSIIAAVENAQLNSMQTNLDNSNNTSTEAQTVNIGRRARSPDRSQTFSADMYDEEVYDNVRSNNSSVTEDNTGHALRNVSGNA